MALQRVDGRFADVLHYSTRPLTYQPRAPTLLSRGVRPARRPARAQGRLWCRAREAEERADGAGSTAVLVVGAGTSRHPIATQVVVVLVDHHPCADLLAQRPGQ